MSKIVIILIYKFGSIQLCKNEISSSLGRDAHARLSYCE